MFVYLPSSVTASHHLPIWDQYGTNNCNKGTTLCLCADAKESYSIVNTYRYVCTAAGSPAKFTFLTSDE